MLSNEQLRNFYNKQPKTLEDIRVTLKLKGKSYMYTKNTSKKYNIHLSPDTELTKEQSDIIIINTLGKLNRVQEQAKYLKMLSAPTLKPFKISGLSKVGELEVPKLPELEKARNFASKESLVNTIIHYVEPLLQENNLIEAINKALEKEPNVKYITLSSRRDLLKDKAKWAIEKYKSMK